MDGQRFDQIVKELATTISRRDAVRRIAGSFGGATLAFIGVRRGNARDHAAGYVSISLSTQERAPGFTVEPAGGARYGRMVAAANKDRSYKLLRRYLGKQGFTDDGMDPTGYLVFVDGSLIRTVVTDLFYKGDQVAALAYGVEDDGAAWRYAIVYQSATPLYQLTVGGDAEIVQGSAPTADAPGAIALRAMPDGLLADEENCSNCTKTCGIIIVIGCAVAVFYLVPLVCGPAALACTAVTALLLRIDISLLCYTASSLGCPAACQKFEFCAPPPSSCLSGECCCYNTGGRCPPGMSCGGDGICYQLCQSDVDCQSGAVGSGFVCCTSTNPRFCLPPTNPPSGGSSCRGHGICRNQ
jgi:hypothetical protein